MPQPQPVQLSRLGLNRPQPMLLGQQLRLLLLLLLILAKSERATATWNYSQENRTLAKTLVADISIKKSLKSLQSWCQIKLLFSSLKKTNCNLNLKKRQNESVGH